MDRISCAKFMKRIRKGKTIILRWPIKTNGEAASLEGRNLTLMLQCSLSARTIPFEVADNVITATIQGKSLTTTGKYILTLYENRGEDNQTVVDVDAFMIVSRTKDEGEHHCSCHPSPDGEPTGDGLDTDTVDLEAGNLEVFTGESTVSCGCSLTQEEISAIKTLASSNILGLIEELNERVLNLHDNTNERFSNVYDNIGNLKDLRTFSKENLVTAINETYNHADVALYKADEACGSTDTLLEKITELQQKIDGLTK